MNINTQETKKILNRVNESFSQNVRASARFRGQVLTRIYRVWLFRKFLPVMVVEIIVLVGVIFWLSRAVFIQRVIENAFNVFFVNPPAVFSFVIWAFINAGMLTKALVLMMAIAFALFLRHLTQGILRLILVRENFFGRTGNSPS